jgi:hypothetical protein
MHQVLLENEDSTVRPECGLLDLAVVSSISPEVKTVRCDCPCLANEVTGVASVGWIPLLMNKQSECISQHTLLKN